MDANKIHSSVVDVIGELTSKALAFSAFDITKILRKRNVDVYHNLVKKEVSDYYSNMLMSNDYYKINLTLPNGRTTWVYYPGGYDTDNYDMDALPDMLDMTPVIAPITPTVIASTGAINPFISPDQKYTDKRGRLCIPAHMLGSLGYYMGTTVYVKQINDKVYVGNDKNADIGTILFPYKVDKSCNIRISNSTLNYFKFGSVFKLTLDNNGILIESM